MSRQAFKDFVEIIKVEEIEGLYETKTLDVLEFDKISHLLLRRQ